MKTEDNYSIKECLKVTGASFDCYNQLIAFRDELLILEKTSSKQTHYHNLNEWSDAAFGFVHKMLNKYGFVNGQKEQNDNAMFWWKVYSVVSSVTYSTNLNTKTARHHASAYERNEALLKDVDFLISKFCVN